MNHGQGHCSAADIVFMAILVASMLMSVLLCTQLFQLDSLYYQVPRSTTADSDPCRPASPLSFHSVGSLSPRVCYHWSHRPLSHFALCSAPLRETPWLCSYPSDLFSLLWPMLTLSMLEGEAKVHLAQRRLGFHYIFRPWFLH